MMAERPEPVRDLDWEPARARAFVDGVADIYEELLARLPDLPVIVDQGVGEVHAGVVVDVPDGPTPEVELLGYLRRMTFDHSALPGHPRFSAYVSGAGTVPGAAADLLASGINMNVGGWRLSPSATEIEMALTRWFAQRMFGMPDGSGGALTSGGALANLIALKVARDARAGWDVRADGIAAGPPLGFYLSSETHVVSDRAADMLGVGAANVRHVPVDDLDAIADVCRDEGMWLHVDAAYGGPAVLADDLRPLFAGIERADSIAFDPHKWLYTPLPGGCVLVRDMKLMRHAFDPDHVAYIVKDEEHTDWGIDLSRYSPNFSRGFWALKVWISLLAHGRDAYAHRISHDAALARYLGAVVDERADFELMTPVGLSIACFRYVPANLPGPGADGREEYLDRLNQRIMTSIQLGGRAYCSNAVLGGRFCLRSCIVNFRTAADDLDALVEAAAELGAALDAELRPPEL
ncbi:pyridoxal-dependent decarboxylase [soil metagenome]